MAVILLVGVVWILAPVTARAGTGAWSQVAPLNTARDAHGAASGPCQGNVGATGVYTIGGLNSNSNPRKSRKEQ